MPASCGFSLSYDHLSDTVEVTRPDHRLVPVVPEPPVLRGDLEDSDAEAGLHIGPGTCESLWGGEHLDLAAGIDAMFVITGRLDQLAGRVPGPSRVPDPDPDPGADRDATDASAQASTGGRE
ncbi:MAG: hypothetical protein ACRD0J_11265 [Acidimicrobiales bacterium]